MKLLVFAHVPPPHHGQSQMVQYLVDGFRERPELGVEVVHVDARLSGDLQDVGSARGGKVLQLLKYCGQAIAARVRTGVRTLYYIPSPPKRTPLVRDWMVFLLLRPWFREVVFHWEAAGLGEWLETQARPWERVLTRALLGGPALSVVLAETNRRDAEVVSSRQTRVVHNALKDPCPDFVRTLGPRRRARLEELRERGGEVRVLFLALCSRDKGLFDAMEAVARANAEAAVRIPGRVLRFRLTVAGAFPDSDVEREFREWCARPGREGMVTRAGFLSGVEKDAAWLAADVFLFPTYYANEGQPVSLIEAMAYGVPSVTTRWRGIPEMLPPGYAGLVEPRDPVVQSEALLAVSLGEGGFELRREYERRFTLDRYLEGMASAIRGIGEGA
ncbi:MAG: glycosyltransferase family 4 protein [Verrucomicrobiota bacterium]